MPGRLARGGEDCDLCVQAVHGFDTFLEVLYAARLFPELATVSEPLVPKPRYAPQRSKMKDGDSTVMMRFRSAMRLAFSRLVSVTMCLCALAFLPHPQHAVLALVETSEAECPVQEEGKGSKEELVVRPPARRRSHDRVQCDVSRSRKTSGCFQKSNSRAVCLPAIVGHQIANGLSAPLLI